MTATSGSGLLYHVFENYAPLKSGSVGTRQRGVLISMVTGKAVAFGLFGLQERGDLFLVHGDEVYEGMLVGIHSRNNDLVVNPTKAKQLTNMRASGSDEALTLSAIQKMTLEQALEFIDEDELVEVTPISIRLRKKLLTENDRKRYSRSGS
jgi:GTP-binding protein